jgi:uncharacterized protein YndB with AHSA1/START domain
MSRNELEYVVDPVEPIITTRRVVDAPRALVWDCFTKPEHLRRWKTPPGCEMILCEPDFRTGGTWRVRYRRPDGAEFGFHGDVREAVATERFVRTFIMDGSEDETLETVVLTDAGRGKTLITNTYVYTSMAVRDRTVELGGSKGAQGGYAALDTLLESLTISGDAER